MKNKELLLDQLKRMPIVQVACEKTGIGRATYYRWCKEDPEFAEKAEYAKYIGTHLANDMAESQLLTNIKNGHFSSIAFWLKHKHKDYSTKVHLSGSVNTPKELTKEQQELINKAINLVFREESYEIE
ncbi:MAG: hypothetical protein R3B92_04170 [Patescibacteria group bacterium]